MKMHLEDLEKDILTLQDQINLRTIFKFLKPFHRATLETQGDTARLDKVLITMDILLTHIETSLVRILLFFKIKTNSYRNKVKRKRIFIFEFNATRKNTIYTINERTTRYTT